MGILTSRGRNALRRRRALVLAFACLVPVVLVGIDVSRPPASQVTARAALAAIHWYQSSLSPHIGGQCRFTPTCSVYARTVIERHGTLEGGWLAARRVARCGPWTKAGTVDPPM